MVNLKAIVGFPGCLKPKMKQTSVNESVVVLQIYCLKTKGETSFIQFFNVQCGKVLKVLEVQGFEFLLLYYGDSIIPM